MTLRAWASFAVTGAAIGLTAPASADITGTIDATITLEAGCIVNGQNLDNGAAGADFGTLDFGTRNTLFTQADAQVLTGASALTIQCSPGITPTLTFQAGQNDGDGAGLGLRAMADPGAPGQFVTYNLYSDSGRNTVIPINGTMVLSNSGAQQSVNVFGRAFGEPALVPGTYTDTITVLLEL